MSEEKRDLKLANSVYDMLCYTLDDIDWIYEKQKEDLRVNFKVKGEELPSADIKIKVHPQRHLVLLLCLLPITVAKNRRNAVAVAVSKANYRICDGSFDYSYLNGEIIFRISLGYSGCTLGKETLTYMLSCACNTIDNFYNKFKYVAENDMSIDQIIEYMKG